MVQFCFPLYIRRFSELNTQSHVTSNSFSFCSLRLPEQAHYKTILKIYFSNMQLYELGSVSLMNMNNHLLNKRKMKVCVCVRTFAWVLPCLGFLCCVPNATVPPCFLIPTQENNMRYDDLIIVEWTDTQLELLLETKHSTKRLVSHSW